jgi:acetolactate synthase-1/2/3 large subunit
MRRWLEERDLILVVGSSYNVAQLNVPLVQIDVDPAQVRPGEKGVGLVGDARSVLDQLLEYADRLQGSREGSLEGVEQEVAAFNQARFDPAQQLQPQMGYMDAIRAALPDDAILTTDQTQLGYYSRNYYPVYAPRAYFITTRLWTLGAAFPMALGAKVAQPQRKVATVIGDGGFLYNAQELATAVQNKIALAIVLFNDNAYGNVLRAQQEDYDGHVLGTQLHNPDFVQFAQSFGVPASRVHSAAELEQTLRQSLENEEGPTLIEVPVGPMQRLY